MEKDVLILIPAYNEEKNLGGVLAALDALPLRARADVLVVNDASRDRTAALAAAAGARVVDHVYNLGYGMALQTGYKYAAGRGYR